MHVLNINNKPYFSIFDSMPVISAIIFLAREDLSPKPVI
jgi:recombinational DNA repair protein RecT